MFEEKGQFDNLFPAYWFHLDGWFNKNPYNGVFPNDPYYSAEELVEAFKILDKENIPATVNMLITSDVTKDRPFFNPKSVEVMPQVKDALKPGDD